MLTFKKEENIRNDLIKEWRSTGYEELLLTRGS